MGLGGIALPQPQRVKTLFYGRTQHFPRSGGGVAAKKRTPLGLWHAACI
jgi:hypothetical protein